jgi:hypothetical protein
MIGVHSITVAGNDISCLVDQAVVHYGRDDSGGQPEAATVTIDIDVADTVLPAYVEIGAPVIVETTLAGTAHRRFTGLVTDVNLAWDDEGEHTPNAGIAQVIAVSSLASLGRVVVGDAPFPQELDGARVVRVLNLAGIVPDPLRTDPGVVQILARDIDSSDALGVIEDTADSAAGILWETLDGQILYADSEHRRNAIVDLELDACDVLVTPTWQRNLAGLVNKVSIGYGVAVEGGEQPRYLAQNDVSIGRYDLFNYTTTTELAALADATALGNLLLARNSAPVWVMAALPVDVEALSAADTATLLGLEMHSLLRLTGLPLVGNAPTTAALWVEGFTETLAWGVHDLELSVSGYCRTAPAPRWDDVDPALTWDGAHGTWDQAVCFGPPIPGDTWADVPASLRWDAVPVGITWDTWQPVEGRTFDEAREAA